MRHGMWRKTELHLPVAHYGSTKVFRACINPQRQEHGCNFVYVCAIGSRLATSLPPQNCKSFNWICAIVPFLPWLLKGPCLPERLGGQQSAPALLCKSYLKYQTRTAMYCCTVLLNFFDETQYGIGHKSLRTVTVQVLFAAHHMCSFIPAKYPRWRLFSIGHGTIICSQSW